MKFNFDLTTIKGRKIAVEQFAKAINKALPKEKDNEEAVIVMYKDGDHILGGMAGRGSEISKLQAKMLAQCPEIIEPTLKMVPVMLLAKHLEGHEEEDDE